MKGGKKKIDGRDVSRGRWWTGMVQSICLGTYDTVRRVRKNQAECFGSTFRPKPGRLECLRKRQDNIMPTAPPKSAAEMAHMSIGHRVGISC